MKTKAQSAYTDVRNATHVYVAFAQCGCVSGVAADMPMNGSDIGKWIKQGRRLEHMTLEAWRGMTFTLSSKCPHKPTQGNLLEPVA